jgi:serine/threonine-protein kinase
LVGRQVGPYIIEAEIGQGGMGSVWRARRADGRYEGVVAIKFVRAALMGQLGEQRFHVEGRLLGRLNHPNIARLLDAGIVENQPYLVLEYVEGKPLDVHCARLGLNLQERLYLFLDVLAAVSHAHKHLIVHKDIKPSNIFVTSAGEVKLLDFGIAKLLDVEGEPGAATQTSAALMTPQFAAPEQLLGQPVTTATDVYTAGLVLYLLLTGSHPVRSPSQSSAELIQSVLIKDFPRPSTVAELDTVSPAALAGDLDNIISRALNKSPLERYPSASAFAEDIQRYLANLPVQARPATVRYRVRKFVRRNRGGVAAAALVALSLLAGTVGTVMQAKRAEASATQALEARQRALRQLTYAEATNEFLLFLLEDESNKSFTTRDLLLRGEALANQEFADDPQLRAKLLLALSGMYEEMEESKKAQGLLVSAQQAARAGADRSLAVEADCALGLGLGGGGQYRESLDLLGSGIRAAAEDPAVEPGVRALCLANRGAVYVELKQGDTALGDAQDALTILGTPRPGQHRLVLFARQALADAHDLQGDYSGGVEEYQQVLNELDRMGRGQTTCGLRSRATMRNCSWIWGGLRKLVRCSTVPSRWRHAGTILGRSCLPRYCLLLPGAQPAMWLNASPG